MGDRLKLLAEIEARLAKAKSDKQANPKRKTKPTPSTRGEINKANSKDSTGPRTPSGKEKSSANSLKHGFFAHIAKLHPHDSRNFIQLHLDLSQGLQPDGPAEEHLIEELAMLCARIKRLESAEHALILGNIDGDPNIPAPPPTNGVIDYDHLGESIITSDILITDTPDAREIAAAMERQLDTLERLNKIETHLRRAYNRTWDRLERMQRERHKMPLDQALKRSQIWLTYYQQKANIDAQHARDLAKPHPQDPRIDEKGKLITYPKDHPLWQPTKQEEDDELNGKNRKIE